MTVTSITKGSRPSKLAPVSRTGSATASLGCAAEPGRAGFHRDWLDCSLSRESHSLSDCEISCYRPLSELEVSADRQRLEDSLQDIMLQAFLPAEPCTGAGAANLRPGDLAAGPDSDRIGRPACCEEMVVRANRLQVLEDRANRLQVLEDRASRLLQRDGGPTRSCQQVTGPCMAAYCSAHPPSVASCTLKLIPP